MIAIIPLNAYAMRKLNKFQAKELQNKDERIKVMNEVLIGIKMLKMYAWEPSFARKVMRIRSKEISLRKKMVYCNAAVDFLWSSTPFLVYSFVRLLMIFKMIIKR